MEAIYPIFPCRITKPKKYFCWKNTKLLSTIGSEKYLSRLTNVLPYFRESINLKLDAIQMRNPVPVCFDVSGLKLCFDNLLFSWDCIYAWNVTLKIPNWFRFFDFLIIYARNLPNWFAWIFWILLLPFGLSSLQQS